MILHKFWTLEFLEISTLPNHSVTTDYSADSALIFIVIKLLWSFLFGVKYIYIWSVKWGINVFSKSIDSRQPVRTAQADMG